jgi:alpha-D-ribose 1-methylphosphonate 5-triphosphate synthase subunit PhnH
MLLTELKETILNNQDSFDKLLRDNFYFGNVRVLHNNKVNYDALCIVDNFISLTLHDCEEIQDFIYISLEKIDDEKEFEWNGITIYLEQFLDEMD